jgi:hypothetical protein
MTMNGLHSLKRIEECDNLALLFKNSIDELERERALKLKIIEAQLKKIIKIPELKGNTPRRIIKKIKPKQETISMSTIKIEFPNTLKKKQ